MVVRCRGLAEADLHAIKGLEQRVVVADGGRLKLEWGVLRRRPPDQINDLFWWEGAELRGFAGLYSFGQPIEVAGMVDPQARRRGVGTALLGAARQLAGEAGAERILLVTPRSTPAGAAFAQARGGRLEHSEHHMVLGELPPPAPARYPDMTIRPAGDVDRPAVRRVLTAGFGPDGGGPLDGVEGLLVVEQENQVIGTLRVEVGSEATGIYGFVVEPALRGRGIGREVLYRVCRDLRDSGSTPITLEVSVDNDRALGLYTSVGFQRVATEDYFELPVG